MPRTKTGVKRHRKHKKIRDLAKGFAGHRGHSFRGANEGLMHALKYAYRDRRRKKRELRKLWIMRINGALREYSLSYSQFIHQLKEKNVLINRKVLSQIAVHDPKVFGKIVEKVK